MCFSLAGHSLGVSNSHNASSAWITQYGQAARVFKVRGSSDASIFLMAGHSTRDWHHNNDYMVVLGVEQNSRSVIGKYPDSYLVSGSILTIRPHGRNGLTASRGSGSNRVNLITVFVRPRSDNIPDYNFLYGI